MIELLCISAVYIGVSLGKEGGTVSLFESIFYGFVSGVTEFLPVSARAHQVLMRYLFGVEQKIPLQELFLHIGLLAAIVFANRELLSALNRENRIGTSRRSRISAARGAAYYELRLFKTASVPLLIGLLLSIVTVRYEQNFLLIMAFLLLNAVVMLVAEHTSRGNRDARTMTGLDGIVIGVLGAFSVLPGVSRTGMIASYTAARGTDMNRTANWSIVLGLPAVALMIIFDFVGIFSVGVGGLSFLLLLGCIFSGLTAFCGGYVGMKLLRLMLTNSGFSGFAYYSIGASLFTFILYLIT